MEVAAAALEVVLLVEVVGKDVGKDVGIVLVVMDDTTLCTADDSEETKEERVESTEEAAVVSKERVLKGNPLVLHGMCMMSVWQA